MENLRKYAARDDLDHWNRIIVLRISPSLFPEFSATATGSKVD
jgi:hypothetical protein